MIAGSLGAATAAFVDTWNQTVGPALRQLIDAWSIPGAPVFFAIVGLTIFLGLKGELFGGGGGGGETSRRRLGILPVVIIGAIVYVFASGGGGGVLPV